MPTHMEDAAPNPTLSASIAPNTETGGLADSVGTQGEEDIVPMDVDPAPTVTEDKQEETDMKIDPPPISTLTSSVSNRCNNARTHTRPCGPP